jgi:hypothetical protein
MLDEGLASIDPARAEDRHPADSVAAELLTAILASDPEQAVALSSGTARRAERATPDRSSSRPRRRALAAVAVGGVALTAAIVGLPGGGDGEHSTLPILDRVAEAAAAQPPLDTSLPYFYTKTRGTYTDTSVWDREHVWSTYDTQVVETWVAKDGSARRVTSATAPKFVGAKDREAWVDAGKPNFLTDGFNSSTHTELFPPGSFSDHPYSGTQISQIPTDPDELAQWLQNKATDPKAGAGAGNGFSVTIRTLTMVSDLLQNPFATPELRAALYEAEGQVPGIEYLGRASDEIGREGIAIGAESANSGRPTIYSLIVDPNTSQVLASKEDPLDPNARLNETVFITSGTTSSLTDAP